VRTYLPEFRVQDEEAAATVTVRELLNHTAGWDGDFFRNTGDGDDALERYVDAMAGLAQLTRPGEAVSYNNASFGVAGRVIEQVTGKVYERALRELVLEPLELRDSFFFPREVMLRRFAVDHHSLPDGSFDVLAFGFPRATNCVGGLATTTHDLLAWAQFHLDAAGLVAEMREPTVHAPGWAPGDAVGLSWLLADTAGLQVAGHDGATLGQLSVFKLVPERRFALVAFTNASPVGGAFNERIARWAWEELLDARVPEPETVSRTPEELAEFCGRYETVANILEVTASDGGLAFAIVDRPEALAELGIEEVRPDPPVPFRFSATRADRFICPEPPHRGSTGFFVRDADGRVTAMNVAGRHVLRTG
jgi:CubicO group peptidase (beta-lactamase class C family)